MREFVGVHLRAQQPGIGTIVLTREPSNALTRQAYRELASAAAEVADRSDIRAVILFGGHEIFSAGDDLHELHTLSPAEAEVADRVRRQAIEAVAAIPKPTVAAVTGYALGAGLSLALAADWRVCGDNAKLGATEVLAGILSGTPADQVPRGGCGRLARAVGPARAKELAFSGRFVGAEEALALGLVEELVGPDQVYDTAVGWAARFVETAPAALAALKARIDASPGEKPVPPAR